MGEKYNRQIRRAVDQKYKSAFNEVRCYLEAKARSANFYQRLKIAMRFLFHKDFNVFW